MRQVLELPRLSLNERDRRWALIRERMKNQGLDCLVLFGMPTMWDFTTANARFVTHIGGNAAFNITLFPLEQDPTVFVQMPTFIEYWRRSQDWALDVAGSAEVPRSLGEIVQAPPILSRRNTILLAVGGALLAVYWLLRAIADLLRG